MEMKRETVTEPDGRGDEERQTRRQPGREESERQ